MLHPGLVRLETSLQSVQHEVIAVDILAAHRLPDELQAWTIEPAGISVVPQQNAIAFAKVGFQRVVAAPAVARLPLAPSLALACDWIARG